MSLLVQEKEPLTAVDKILEQSRNAQIFKSASSEESDGEDEAEGEQSEQNGDQESEKKAETPSGEEPKQSKYKTLEEAEKGAKEAERLMHRKAQEAKEKEERLAQAEALIESLKTELTTAQKARNEEEAKASDETILQTLEEGMKQMAKFDPSDDDYYKKVAEVWFKIMKATSETAAKKVTSEVVERKTAEQREAEKTENAHRRIWNAAVDAATEAGLDMRYDLGKKDEEGNPIQALDYKLFWAIAKTVPKGLSIEEEVQWTIKEVKKIRGEIGTVEVEKSKKAREKQEQNAPLERQGSGPKPPSKQEPVAPLSVDEALKRAQRRRKV